MNRRHCLVLAGGGIAGLAGCAGGDSTTTETNPTDSATASPTVSPTPTATSSPTVSATPETRPEIMFANLVSEFTQYGDVRAKKIESEPAGDVIQVGFRSRIYIHDGTMHTFDQIDVHDADRRVGSQTTEDEQVFDLSGYELFESALAFDTRGWGAGEYEASVRTRDEVTGKVSNEERFEFELE